MLLIPYCGLWATTHFITFCFRGARLCKTWKIVLQAFWRFFTVFLWTLATIFSPVILPNQTGEIQDKRRTGKFKKLSIADEQCLNVMSKASSEMVLRKAWPTCSEGRETRRKCSSTDELAWKLLATGHFKFWFKSLWICTTEVKKDVQKCTTDLCSHLQNRWWFCHGLFLHYTFQSMVWEISHSKVLFAKQYYLESTWYIEYSPLTIDHCRNLAMITQWTGLPSHQNSTLFCQDVTHNLDSGTKGSQHPKKTLERKASGLSLKTLHLSSRSFFSSRSSWGRVPDSSPVGVSPRCLRIVTQPIKILWLPLPLDGWLI